MPGGLIPGLLCLPDNPVVLLRPIKPHLPPIGIVECVLRRVEPIVRIVVSNGEDDRDSGCFARVEKGFRLCLLALFGVHPKRSDDVPGIDDRIKHPGLLCKSNRVGNILQTRFPVVRSEVNVAIREHKDVHTTVLSTHRNGFGRRTD